MAYASSNMLHFPKIAIILLDVGHHDELLGRLPGNVLFRSICSIYVVRISICLLTIYSGLSIISAIKK